MDAGKIVNEAILGEDFKTVVVNGKAYTIFPPTIHKISGAAKCLSSIKTSETVEGVIRSLGSVDNAARALSWFINDDESLLDELSDGTFEEVVDALCVAYSMISVENFIKLSDLAKNIVSLTAKQKP